MAAGLIADLFEFLAPNAPALAVAVALDLAIGDPRYPYHPVRLIGATLRTIEKSLRRAGADSYGGGIALFAILAALWLGVLIAVMAACLWLAPGLAWAFHIFVLYSLLALGDLNTAVWRVEHAAMRGDLAGARAAVSQLVGRDTESLDMGGCRRAAIESFAESLTDGFISPLLWYAVLGLPGIVLFKVVSTMDSMVGYKTPLYLRFGWCGARLDDVMNYIPARVSLPLIALAASLLPGCSTAKTWRVGLRQHAVLPSPNSGWSEAATAGAIQRRLVGPIRVRGTLVTDIWLGEPSDPPAATHDDVMRATILLLLAGLLATALGVGLIL